MTRASPTDITDPAPHLQCPACRSCLHLCPGSPDVLCPVARFVFPEFSVNGIMRHGLEIHWQLACPECAPISSQAGRLCPDAPPHSVTCGPTLRGSQVWAITSEGAVNVYGQGFVCSGIVDFDSKASYCWGTTAVPCKPLCRLCLRGLRPGLARLPSALPEPQAELNVLRGLIHHPHFFSGEGSV